jgi:outer membrane protein TolC
MLLLLGCAAPRRLPAPSLPAADPAPPAAVGVPLPSADAPSPGALQAQGPLSLDEAVALALASNPDLRAAAARIAEAEAKVGEATSLFYPQIGARLAYARTDNPAQAFAMILNQRRFTPDLNFNDPGATQNVRPEVVGVLPLFNGGRDYHSREATLLGVQAAKLERLALRNALTDAVIGAYYAVVAAPEQVAAARSSVEAVTSALEQARTRYGAGTALRADVLSLEVRQAEAREGEVRAENGVELARTGLRTLLALAPEAPVEAASPLDVVMSEPAPTFGDALARAATNRPELAAAARQVEMREHEVEAERAAYLPRVGAVGSFGNDSSNFELSSSRDSWAFGVAAEIDLFSGFRTRERVRAAEQRLDQARQAQRQAQLAIESDVRTAFLAFTEARQRAQVSQKAAVSAEEALRLVQVQYEAGAATITRYLEVEAARGAARSRDIAARYDLRRAEASLAKAMGEWASDEAGEK